MRIAFIFFLSIACFAQDNAARLRGQVTDPSGKSVPGASVSISLGSAVRQTVKSDEQGRYEIRGIVPGTYAVRATAKGFAASETPAYEVSPGAAQVLDLSLRLALASEQVAVLDSANTVDVSADNNASALVLSGSDLDALSDDPDDLAADLAALAGPAAGPNGGQIFIDGFTGGRLPPKASIREIRINQSPFSAQYDRLGYGRVEIFTKPGTEDFHGEVLFQYGSDLFNSRNPFTPVKPPYERRQWEGEATGPLGKKTTFSGDFEIRKMTEDAFINAVTLGSNYQPLPVSIGVTTPVSSTEENLKLDRQLTTNHTLSLRYTFALDSRDNQGIGGFSLAERAYNNRDTENTVQAIETGVINPHLTNEVRFRYLRTRSRQSGQSGKPTISVLDSFTGGASPLTFSYTNDDRFEGVNVTSLVHGAHLFRFGARVRAVHLSDQDTSNYAGTFTFSSLDAYRLTLIGLQNKLTPADIRASGGGASQFSITGGNALAQLAQFDIGVFAQDDWRFRPNATVSYGIRYEGQSHLSDHGNVAPRIGVAWGLGPKNKAPKTVIRAGAGVFYDRVSESIALDVLRRDGVRQQQFVVDSPDFYPAVPSAAQLASGLVPQSVDRVFAGLNAPRLLQTAFGLDRQLAKPLTVTSNFVHTWGRDQLRMRNINAPIGGAFPYGGNQAIYLYESDGRFRQDQWITTANLRLKKVSLTANYTLGKAMSDTDGAGTFPADSYNLRSEWGRAGFDIRQRLQLNGTINAPLGVRLSPLLVATSGRPFNITLGRDINNDTRFTDRPTIATDLSRPSVVSTPWGIFDTAPVPGQTIIARNAGSGPAQFALNLRLQKIFTIGEPPRGGKGGRDPFELVFSLNARNILNHPNLGTPVGNLSSLLFGQSTSISGAGGGNSAAGNRRIDLQVKFTF
jgi:hypothetical protein